MINNIKSITTALGVTLLLVGCGETDNTEQLKNYFNRSIPLLCSVSLYRYGEHVLVSKKNGYTIYKQDFFKKGDRVLFIKSCNTVDGTRR